MTTKTTHLAVVELTCDACGKVEAVTRIEGLQPEGERLNFNPGWLNFDLLGINRLSPGFRDVCSRECFIKVALEMYEKATA